jgi:hypothetical protein
MPSAEKRRSDRLMLTIPLRVQGVDARGEAFETSARTVVLSRYGAQVRIPRPMRSQQTVHLVNPIAQGEADFRVVEPLSASTETGGDYGVECLDSNGNFWKIHFPAPANGNPADAKALLECRMCHTVSLADLSLGELEALRTTGIVAKNCESCKAVTPTRYAEIQVPRQARADAGWMSVLARLAKPRRHRRVCLQVPLGVRDSLEGVEVTRTENASRGGFCFTSYKNYQSAQQVRVVFPGNSISRQFEIPGEIVWQQPIEKTSRKIYGMRCERPGD